MGKVAVTLLLCLLAAMALVVQGRKLQEGSNREGRMMLVSHCTPEDLMSFFATNRATKHMRGLNASP
jgi:hypothetical protein